jgi:hypothetical protein
VHLLLLEGNQLGITNTRQGRFADGDANLRKLGPFCQQLKKLPSLSFPCRPLFLFYFFLNQNRRAHLRNVTFLVVDELRDDVILGLQWLRDSRATMDFALGCVHHRVTDRSTSYWNRECPWSDNNAGAFFKPNGMTRYWYVAPSGVANAVNLFDA